MENGARSKSQGIFKIFVIVFRTYHYILSILPPAGEDTLPWAISFFLNEKKMNIFCLMHIALFLSDLLYPNFV